MGKQAVHSAFGTLIFLEVLGLMFRPDSAADFTWLGLIATAGFVWAMSALLRMPTVVAGLFLAATTLDAVSVPLDLYSRFEFWDAWMHVFGGAAIAAGALVLIHRGFREGLYTSAHPGRFTIVGTYLATVAIGFLYEFLEYLVDRFQYGEPRSLVSAYDSIEDQLWNLAGATVVLIAWRIWRQRRV